MRRGQNTRSYDEAGGGRTVRDRSSLLLSVFSSPSRTMKRYCCTSVPYLSRKVEANIAYLVLSQYTGVDALTSDPSNRPTGTLVW